MPPHTSALQLAFCRSWQHDRAHTTHHQQLKICMEMKEMQRCQVLQAGGWYQCPVAAKVSMSECTLERGPRDEHILGTIEHNLGPTESSLAVALGAARCRRAAEPSSCTFWRVKARDPFLPWHVHGASPSCQSSRHTVPHPTAAARRCPETRPQHRDGRLQLCINGCLLEALVSQHLT